MFKIKRKSNRKYLPDNIRRLRIERGWSQAKLGSFFGLSRQSVSKWEVGKSLPDSSLYSKIADVFGVDEKDLFAAPELDLIDKFKRYKVLKKTSLTIALVFPIYMFVNLFLSIMFPLTQPNTPMYYAEKFEERDIYQVDENTYSLTLTFFTSHDVNEIKIQKIEPLFLHNYISIKDCILKHHSEIKFVYHTYIMYGNLYTLNINFRYNSTNKDKVILKNIVVKFDNTLETFNYQNSILYFKYLNIFNVTSINSYGFSLKLNDHYIKNESYKLFLKIDNYFTGCHLFDSNNTEFYYENSSLINDNTLFKRFNISIKSENVSTIDFFEVNFIVIFEPSDNYVANFDLENNFISGV